MAKSKPTPMNRKAASRIVKHETQVNGGKTPAGGFGTRADRTVQQREARTRTSPSPKP